MPTDTLAAPMSPKFRLDSLEALRGLAAIFVVTVHATHTLAGAKDYGHEPFYGLFHFGRAGVDFFFVLSGFIITYIHTADIGRPAGFAPFCYKRLLRIYPAYWIITLLFGALLVISPTPDRSERNLVHALSSFFLWPEMAEPVLGVGWSLRHELLFYTMFGVAILNRQIGAILFTGWFLGILWNVTVQLSTGEPYFSGIPGSLVFRGFNLEFLFGIAAATVVRGGTVWQPVGCVIAGAIVFMTTGLWEAFGTPIMHEWPIRHIAYATGAAALLYGMATLDKQHRSRVPALGLRMGAASYSIYLIHIPVILVLEFGLRSVRHFIPVPIELAFVGIVAGAVLAGTIFSELVEQPILRLGRDMLSSRPKLQTRTQQS